MPLTWNEITERVLASLSTEEIGSSVVYLDAQLLPAESPITIDRTQRHMPWPGMIAFVDLDPEANWGHDCRYLLVNQETGELRSIDARFPPFLGGASATLKLIWKGEAVPSWVLAVE